MAKLQDEGIMLFRNVETARKLSGKQASERLALYEEARAQFNSVAKKTLGVCSVNADGEFRGSNVFARALLNRFSPEGTRLGNLYDFLKISDKSPAYLSETYEEDNAVVLRSLEDSANSANTYLAKTLAKKVGVKSFKVPLVVTHLDVKDDERSEYGLVLVPSLSTKVVVAPSLVGSNNERRFTFYDANGMPIFNEDTDKTGKRRVWTRDRGLSGLYLSRNLYLGSNDVNLAVSSGDGRVVELSSEAVDADFEAQLTRMYKAQQSELSRRFEDAKKLLRGEK